jgi:hypothetical protein
VKFSACTFARSWVLDEDAVRRSRVAGRAVSIAAWCSAASGTVLILVSTLLSDRLLVPAAAAGLLLVVLGVAVLSVRLPRD